MNTMYRRSKTACVMLSLISLWIPTGFCQSSLDHEDHVVFEIPQSFEFTPDGGGGSLPILSTSQKKFSSGPEMTNGSKDKTIPLSGSLTQGNVFIQDSLNIGLEDGAVGYRVAVDGKIMCEELKVQNSEAWPDYVFASDYPLLSIPELEKHLQQYQHLPGIPSAAEIDDEGILVGDMQRRMMEKIEELTLYIIEQDKRIQELEKNQAKAKATQRANSSASANSNSIALKGQLINNNGQRCKTQ